MILIEEILVSDELLSEEFVCNIKKCKGACCVEGDLGAPLTDRELSIIDNDLEKILPYLPSAAVTAIKKKGFFTKRKKQYDTALMPDGACVFMGTDELGIRYCGIQKANKDGKTDFQKPISCHLYPIRVVDNRMTGFKALNYDRWDICSAACDYGKSLKTKVYKFAKVALIRAFGPDFYEALEAADQDLYPKD